MTKEITVKLTLEWTFDKRAWSEEQKHIETLINDPKLCFGYDVINSLFILNELDYPNITDYKITSA
jgi:hypothetical protein|tara:strand:+ start:474 stop:671 length:198 start_codon:yes stop_codon:yes gene_type:complete